MENARADAFEPYVRSFGLHLRAQNKAPKTMEIYLWAARKLADWLTANTEVRAWPAMTRRHYQQFIAVQLEEHAKASYASMLHRALQQFFKWMSSPEEAELDVNPLAGMVPPRVPPTPVPVPDLDKVRTLVKGLVGKDFTTRRDAAIIALFVDTGSRRGELAGVMLADLDMDRREVTITGKGSRTRTVRFGRRAAVTVDRYLRVRDQSKWAHRPELWLAEKNRGVLGGSGIYQMIERRAAEAGFDHLHPHQFRHLFAHLWLDAGGEEGDLMALMGWKSRAMVDRYADDKRSRRARDAHDRLGVLDRLGP
jgi:integrase/recombinase XerC